MIPTMGLVKRMARSALRIRAAAKRCLSDCRRCHSHRQSQTSCNHRPLPPGHPKQALTVSVSRFPITYIALRKYIKTIAEGSMYTNFYILNADVLTSMCSAIYRSESDPKIYPPGLRSKGHRNETFLPPLPNASTRCPIP